MTVLILWETAGSIFTTLLGFSPVLYAGALDGQFFAVFARLHPTKHFPYISVLALGGVGTLLCFVELDVLIKAISAIGAITLNIPQVIAVFVIRKYRPNIIRPFSMWLYPVTAIVALAGWLFVLASNDLWVLVAAFSFVTAGIVVFLGRSYVNGTWPYHRALAAASGD